MFDHAIGRGCRETANPVDGVLRRALPKSKHKPKHHKALGWREVPSFVVDLAQREAIAALCLRFIILTVARSSDPFIPVIVSSEVAAEIGAIDGGMTNADPDSATNLALSGSVIDLSRMNRMFCLIGTVLSACGHLYLLGQQTLDLWTQKGNFSPRGKPHRAYASR